MQFECIECRKQLNLPDGKLPHGKTFSFTCPYCKTKNTAVAPPESGAAGPENIQTDPPVDQQAQARTETPDPEPKGQEAGLPESEAPPANHHQAPAPPAPLRPQDLPDGALPSPEAELFTDPADTGGAVMDDRPRALVVFDDPETAELVAAKLEAINHRVTVAINIRDAAKQIRFMSFSIMVLQGDYMGANLSGNHLLRSVQVMDNHSRRGMLVALTSPDVVTLDDLVAFSLSVDAVINNADLDHIDQLLLSSLAQAKKFYSVYEEVLAEHGLD